LAGRIQPESIEARFERAPNVRIVEHRHGSAECGVRSAECGSAGVRECGSAGVRECGSLLLRDMTVNSEIGT
jgi:hypothetical protein